MNDLENHNTQRSVDWPYSDPDADTISSLMTGARNFKIMMQGLDLGVFDELEMQKEPVTAAVFAKKMGFELTMTNRFLNALVSLKLLQKDTKKNGAVVYSNRPGTSKYFTRSRRPSMIVIAMMEKVFAQDSLDMLPQCLKSGTNSINVLNSGGHLNSKDFDKKDLKKKPPPRKLDGLNDNVVPGKAAPMESVTNENNLTNKTKPPPEVGNGMKSVDAQMKFLLAMDGFAGTCATVIPKVFDLSRYKSTIDLGGGSGIIAMEIARAYPSMQVMVYDLPQFVQLAQKLRGADITENLSFQAGDFFEHQLPSADLFILSHVIHDWGIDKVDAILSKVFQKLPPGGALLVLEKAISEQRDGPEIAMINDLMLSLISPGHDRTESEYRDLLKRHGFRNFRIQRIAGQNYYDAMICLK